MKRWLIKHSAHYRHMGVTVLGDDLYCDQSICLAIRKAGFNFILVCLPESHKTLYSFLDFLEAGGDKQNHVCRHWTGKEHEIETYRFANDVPVRDGKDALIVYFSEITTTKADGTIIYQNAGAYNHLITYAPVIEIVADGRSRWKTENENHLTNKTKGYHLEHNFGHGEKYWANLFVTLNLFAFLFHTVLGLFDNRLKPIRQNLGARKTFFDLLQH